MEKSKKYLLTTIGFIVLTIVAIFFVRFRDNQLAENYTKFPIVPTTGYVTNISKNDDGSVNEHVKIDATVSHIINVGKNDTKHEVGDMVTLYSMGPNYNYYSYSTVELVKHETNMIRYYPLFVIPGICAIVFGVKFIGSKNDEEYED